MIEHFYLFDQKEFERQLQIEGRFIALANPNEVYWAPLDVGVTHEQIAQSLGKDPRLKENNEWFEQFVRFRFDLKIKIVWWTFSPLMSEDPFLNKKKTKEHYSLGFQTLNALKAKYSEISNLQIEIADIEGNLDKYSCVSSFKEVNGKWQLVEMSTREEQRGLTLKEAQLKYNP
jgi:hypothetical protein